MGVDADLRAGGEDVPVGPDPGPDVLGGQPPGGVGDVDAVCPVGLHEQGLRGQFGRLAHMTHHEEPRDVHPEIAGLGDVLRRDVRLGAVRGDPHGAYADLEGPAQFGDRADPGSRSVVMIARGALATAVSIHSQSVWLPGP